MTPCHQTRWICVGLCVDTSYYDTWCETLIRNRQPGRSIAPRNSISANDAHKSTSFLLTRGSLIVYHVVTRTFPHSLTTTKLCEPAIWLQPSTKSTKDNALTDAAVIMAATYNWRRIKTVMALVLNYITTNNTTCCWVHVKFVYNGNQFCFQNIRFQNDVIYKVSSKKQFANWGMPIPMTTDQVNTWTLNKAKVLEIIGLLWAYCTVSK